MTKYIVLFLDTDNSWRKLHGNIEANSKEGALRKVGGVDDGTFVAVPARSWQPMEVKVERQERLAISYLTE